MRMVGRHLAVTGVVIVFSLALSASASAETGFCEFGSGAGQCKEPWGVAVDPVSGNVYAVDHGNDRVNVFGSGGNFLSSFGSTGSGSGQFSGPTGIAVDRDPTSLSYRDVYVLDAGNSRIEKFDSSGLFVLSFAVTGANAIAVGPGGVVYVGITEAVRKYKPSGEFIEQIALGPYGTVGSLAIDSTGAIYALTDAFPEPAIHKYSPTGVELVAFGPSQNVRAIAIDTSGNLFAAELEGAPSGYPTPDIRLVAEYNSSGEVQKRFGYDQIKSNVMGLAIAASGDSVYASEEYVGAPSPGNRVVLIEIPPPGPLACCAEAPSVGSVKATVHAAVNPEGKETTYHFEYVDDAAFDDAGGFTGPDVKKTPESSSVGSDFTLHSVEALIGCPDPVNEADEGKCLTPQTLYHFRVVASNGDGQSAAEGEFETRQAPEVIATWSTDVGADSAQLHATVEPLGIPTTGYFEYVDDARFKANGFVGAPRIPSSTQAPLDFGTGTAQTRSVQLTSLQSATLYHYRIVASNPLSTVKGSEHTFTTFPVSHGRSHCDNDAFRSGLSADLPDCRAYEMVSPVDKNGGDIAVLKNILGFAPAGIEQSAVGGERFTYSSSTAFGGAVSAPYSSQYTATRQAGHEWSTEPISPPRESENLTENAGLKFDTEFKVFSTDLSSAWLLHNTDPPFTGCAPEGFSNIYRRNDSGSYEAITTAAPTNQAAGDTSKYWPELQGLSADSAHAVFRANGKLTANASNTKIQGEPIGQLYEHVSGKGCGQLRLVSVLPNGLASASSSSAGTRNQSFGGEGRENTVARAISADGSRIFWSVSADAIGTGPGALYVRIDGKKTVQISAGPARFWTAATDGSKAFYTLGNTSLGQGELYEFNVDKETQTLIAQGVQGVAEASEAGSRLYFVSREALAGEAEVGKPNLYLQERGGSTTFIAVLGPIESGTGGGGAFEGNGFTVASFPPNRRGTRTTPDGSHLAFVSSGSPTGYDNADAIDGRLNLELYLYDAGVDKLVCISCNPSGSRPEGRRFDFGTTTIKVAAQMAPSENQLYAPRNLSADGSRLFFESFEALLPRDGNGKGDVYEWERAGNQAECDAKGAELFVPSAGGCLSLISSGQSSADSVFADASPDGHDVFFKTDSSLLPQDPGLVDIYDARVDGGLPVPAERASPCEGEACQIPVGPPQDVTPSSSVFHRSQAHKRRCPKGKRLLRRAGKTRCVAKHKRHGKRSRHDKGRAAR